MRNSVPGVPFFWLLDLVIPLILEPFHYGGQVFCVFELSFEDNLTGRVRDAGCGRDDSVESKSGMWVLGGVGASS